MAEQTSRPSPLLLPEVTLAHAPAVLAAAKAGIPVVAFDTPAAREVLGATGALVPEGEGWAGLQAMATRLLADESEWEAVVRRGRGHARRLERRLAPPPPPLPPSLAPAPPRTADPIALRSPVTGKRMLLKRDGGLGDLVMLTPAFRELSRLGYQVSLACRSPWMELFQSHPALEAVHDLDGPLPEADETVDLLRAVDFTSDHPEARRVDRIDLFCRVLGVAPVDRRPDLYLSPAAHVWAADYCRSLGRFAVVQHRATSPFRTYPHTAAVCRALLREVSVVAISDAPWPERPVGVHDLCGTTAIARVAAVISRAAVVVAPDSGATHLAGAQGIPFVAVFGPYPPDLRLGHYAWKRALRGRPDCPPCFEDPVHCGRNPPPCLSEIDPESVAQAALQLVTLREAIQ